MVIKVPDAVSAYKAAQQLGGQSGVGQKTSIPQDKNETFAGLVKSGLENVVQASRGSEQMSANYMAGKADLADVVAAVRNAEMTLSTVVAVRDRVVTSFQEIMRMPI